MFKVEIDKVIAGLFKTLCLNDTKSLGEDEGIYCSVRVSAENFGYESDGNTHHPEWERREDRHIHVVVTLHHSVFIAVWPSPRIEDVPLDCWENTSNHDSCWKTDGFSPLDSIDQELYDKCFDHVPAEHRPIPALAGTYVELGAFFNNTFSLVKIDWLRGDLHKRHISKVSRINWRIVTCADPVSTMSRSWDCKHDLIPVCPEIVSPALDTLSDKYSLHADVFSMDVCIEKPTIDGGKKIYFVPVFRYIDGQNYVSLRVLQGMKID